MIFTGHKLVTIVGSFLIADFSHYLSTAKQPVAMREEVRDVKRSKPAPKVEDSYFRTSKIIEVIIA